MVFQNKKYTFSSYFESVFKDRVGVELNEDCKAEILANIYSLTPHKKVDNKGRPSEYFTFSIQDKLITCVADPSNKKLVTVILETHRPAEYYKKEVGN